MQSLCPSSENTNSMFLLPQASFQSSYSPQVPDACHVSRLETALTVCRIRPSLQYFTKIPKLLSPKGSAATESVIGLEVNRESRALNGKKKKARERFMLAQQFVNLRISIKATRETLSPITLQKLNTVIRGEPRAGNLDQSAV